MVDRFSPDRRSANMARIGQKDTGPELQVRSLLWSLGYRYRLHVRKLPGKPDVVFTGRRKVIFVHGCFWHQHNHPACADGRSPRSNQAYWEPKLRKTAERDCRNQSELEKLGWGVLVVWECELRQPSLSERLLNFLGPARM